MARGVELGRARADLSAAKVRRLAECPRQYEWQYVRKIRTGLADDDEDGAMAAGRDAHAVAERWYRAHERRPAPAGVLDPAGLKKLAGDPDDPFAWPRLPYVGHVLAVERGGKVPWGPHGLTVGYVADLVHVMPDRELGGDVVELVNWKTGHWFPQDEEDLADEPQALIECLVASRARWKGDDGPDVVARRLSWWHLPSASRLDLYPTPEILKRAEDLLDAAARRVQRGDYAPTPGPACDRCPFRLRCDAGQDRAAAAERAARDAAPQPYPDLLDDAAILSALAVVEDALGALATRKADLRTELKRRVQHAGGLIQADGWRARVYEKRSSDVVPAVVSALAVATGRPEADVWADVGRVSSAAARALAKGTAVDVDAYAGEPIKVLDVRRAKA